MSELKQSEKSRDGIKVKDEKYWGQRYNQIQWRKELAQSEVRDMEIHQQECLDEIKKLRSAGGQRD